MAAELEKNRGLLNGKTLHELKFLWKIYVSALYINQTLKCPVILLGIFLLFIWKFTLKMLSELNLYS